MNSSNSFLMRRLYISIMMIAVTLLSCHTSYGHSKGTHAIETLSALGFKYDQRIYEWLCFISSDMIDDYVQFYARLQQKFPGFKYSRRESHRTFFHWSYNGAPWTKGLESRVTAYARLTYGEEKYREYLPQIKEAFLIELREEQRRRNRIINSRTEALFGFDHGGRDGMYANFFAAMAYDLHILGDYMSDNTYIEGLVEFRSLIGGIIESINRLDHREGASLIKSIKSALALPDNVQKKADIIMEIVKQELPVFIKKAQEGSIKRRLEKRGFEFIE